MFAQGHVGQVEQPADLEVVGELLEVLGEMTDRQPGAGGIGVDGGGRDREDARALSPAHDAVVGLAAPQRGHSLEVDEGIAILLSQRLAFLDPGPRLLQDLVGAVRFSFVIEEDGFGHLRG